MKLLPSGIFLIHTFEFKFQNRLCVDQTVSVDQIFRVLSSIGCQCQCLQMHPRHDLFFAHQKAHVLTTPQFLLNVYAQLSLGVVFCVRHLYCPS